MARKRTSVLLIDDNRDLLVLYRDLLARQGSFQITIEHDAARARRLADNCLFDLVAIDVRFPYKGYEYGGTILADDLAPRYGRNSLLLMSQYITSAYLATHGARYEFLAKTADGRGMVTRLLASKIIEMKRRQFVFVAMPFDSEFDEVYDRHLKRSIERSGFIAVRMDHLQHNQRIHERMFELLADAKLVVFLADGANANAYYEAGFADAMRKEVIVVAKSSSELKFDVSTKSTIFYKSKPSSMLRDICRKIEGSSDSSVRGKEYAVT